jgi:hypothetical protein
MAPYSNMSIWERGATIAGAVTAILTLVFLLYPDLQPKPTANREEPPASSAAFQTPQAAAVITASHPEAAPGDVILGVWRQYVYVDPDQLRPLGTFAVGKRGGEYTMAAREQVESADLLNSIGIFDVASDGELWTFNSNWGQGRVGNFELRRMSPTVFEGDVKYLGQVVSRNRWVKVE